MTRLLRNPKVRTGDMIEHAREQTLSRIGGLHVLAIQDTTALRDDGSNVSAKITASTRIL